MLNKMVGFVTTTAPDKAKAFYADRLGFTFIEDDGFALSFDAGGTLLRVAKAQSFTPSQATVLGWEVTDIAATVGELAARGVVFEQFNLPFLVQDALGIWTAPNGDRVAWFKDPDGNTLSISCHQIPTVSRADRLRELTALLESIAADRRVLDELPDEERNRLLRAIAYVYSPDRYARRRQTKAETRDRKASRAQVHDRIKATAAIRTLHRKPVVTTPNVFPPEGFEPHDIGRDADAAVGLADDSGDELHSGVIFGPGSEPRESVEPQHCYVCKQHYTVIHHFYDQLCPACARVQLRQAHRAGRPARPRRAAHRRARQDRLSGRPQAAALRRAR